MLGDVRLLEGKSELEVNSEKQSNPGKYYPITMASISKLHYVSFAPVIKKPAINTEMYPLNQNIKLGLWEGLFC